VRSAPAIPRASLYDEVTDRIIAELEAGRLPCVERRGKAGATGPGLPRNATTGRRYWGVSSLRPAFEGLLSSKRTVRMTRRVVLPACSPP
jgi:antirestriction protein ArdC